MLLFWLFFCHSEKRRADMLILVVFWRAAKKSPFQGFRHHRIKSDDVNGKTERASQTGAHGAQASKPDQASIEARRAVHMNRP